MELEVRMCIWAHPDDSDDVIGPPLPPGFKVLDKSVEGHGHTLNYGSG